MEIMAIFKIVLFFIGIGVFIYLVMNYVGVVFMRDTAIEAQKRFGTLPEWQRLLGTSAIIKVKEKQYLLAPHYHTDSFQVYWQGIEFTKDKDGKAKFKKKALELIPVCGKDDEKLYDYIEVIRKRQ
jgi:hypothetical protein